MDTGGMTFEEILFNGRWHIFGGVLLLVFLGAFIREVIREVVLTFRRRRAANRDVAFGPLYQGARLGHTMTDGGEPSGEDGEREI
jgi:hypothetical protein